MIDINNEKRVNAISIPDLNVRYKTSNMKPKTKGISLLPISSSNLELISASIAPCPREYALVPTNLFSRWFIVIVPITFSTLATLSKA